MTIPNARPIVAANLDRLFTRAVRVVVKESPTDAGKMLFESTDQKDLVDLTRSLILEPPEEWFHCMCIGGPAIYLYEFGGGELVLLTNHHGSSIRCSLWPSDVRISDTEKWLSWFDNRGMPGPRQEVEAMRAREAEGKRDEDRWLAAMPKAIVPVWPDALGEFGKVNVEPLRAVLERELPDERERILVLLEWFGSGSGPWSGYPSYERAAERLLLAYPTRSIVETFQSSSATPAQTEGVARLFGGRSFRQQRPGGLKEVPEALVARLWNHVSETEDQDKLARAASAFRQ